MNPPLPRLTTVLGRGLTALPLLFVLALIAVRAPPSDDPDAAFGPLPAGEDTVRCVESRPALVAVWMPADLPPRLRRAGTGCPF